MSHNPLPLVSIIIPTFNRAHYLLEAINSIFAQNYKNIEIIIVDDGSTDNTSKIINLHNKQLHYIYQENGGQAAARNKGIAIAKGKYLAFLDSDDLWTSNKLHKQIRYMQKHPEVKILFGLVQQFCEEKFRTQYKNEIDKSQPGLIAGTLLIEKSTFLDIGYFKTNWEVGEFIEWFDRAKNMGYTYHLLDEILMKRRLHDQNIGLTKSTGPNNFAQILRESLRKKRKAAMETKKNELQ